MNRDAWTTFSRALARWVLAAMLLAALAPAVSRAMGVRAAGGPPAGQAGADWIEICGPSGLRWVQLDPAKPQPPASILHPAAMDHCALCGVSLDRCLPSAGIVTPAFALAPATGHPASHTGVPPSWPHARPGATGPPDLA